MFLQPFQTMVRGVSALRDDEKKEEKVSRPREPLMSLLDWAKSGGMEGFSLRGALRLPSFKVILDLCTYLHLCIGGFTASNSCVVFIYHYSRHYLIVMTSLKVDVLIHTNILFFQERMWTDLH